MTDLTIDCGEDKHDLCIGWGTEHYPDATRRGGERFECGCPCHRPADERAMRFGHLLSEIEMRAERLRIGSEPDIMGALAVMALHLAEAHEIALEVSREALDKIGAGGDSRSSSPVAPDGPDKVTIRLAEPLPADTEIKDVLPDDD